MPQQLSVKIPGAGPRGEEKEHLKVGRFGGFRPRAPTSEGCPAAALGDGSVTFGRGTGEVSLDNIQPKGRARAPRQKRGKGLKTWHLGGSQPHCSISCAWP